MVSHIQQKLESRQSTDGMNIMGFTSPVINTPEVRQWKWMLQLYSGPKIQSELKDLAAG